VLILGGTIADALLATFAIGGAKPRMSQSDGLLALFVLTRRLLGWPPSTNDELPPYLRVRS
jgi:hypothetical protein